MSTKVEQAPAHKLRLRVPSVLRTPARLTAGVRLSMASIPTQVRRRLRRLRNRRARQREAPTIIQSSQPFRYDACIRLGGLGDAHEKIEKVTGIAPTRSLRRGDPVGARGKTRQEDLWLLASPLGETATTDEHLQWLWNQLKPHAEVFRSFIAQAAWADINIGCLSESSFPILSASATSLQLLREFDVGLTFNFTLV